MRMGVRKGARNNIVHSALSPPRLGCGTKQSNHVHMYGGNELQTEQIVCQDGMEKVLKTCMKVLACVTENEINCEVVEWLKYGRTL